MTTHARPPEDIDPLLLPPRKPPYVLKDVLEKVVHGCLDQLIFDLEDSYLCFQVNPDTDTILPQFHPAPFRVRKSYTSLHDAVPWKDYLDKPMGWTWLAWNQQGYLDSVLLAFDDIEPQILLQALASSIEVFSIAPMLRQVAAPTRNGKRR